jgi:Outer membrane lipoprotein-sorting protein
MNAGCAWALAGWLTLTLSSSATTTNELATAEREGRRLALQLCEQRPEANLTNTGRLVIRSPKNPRQEIPFTSRILLTETNWTTVYEANPGTNPPVTFSVEHCPETPNRYSVSGTTGLLNDQTMTPFAGSDFWLADLGLEFFHWPAQRLWKREMRRGKSCHVLESRRPESWTNGYARVVSWIHMESGAVVQAEAYDARGKLLKEFRPTAVEKVNGEWQLKEMEIENVQAGSRTTLVFDLQPE